ncbi:3,4-dihydroxyphenylacetate 2,3-dioxygenase [Klebsiella pneumoniae]|uniref:3,4-dihydroxyphenylacetate 2,3-dioxygenase n=1 Tax=Klebsiella pneumoniae TaxID=573 RepID=A0A377UWP7_KLEPN|nr:3,4-dihydroxyphenylacetate 2,3-dioxygenase [Klebsiella pneumoniae]
MTAPWRCWQRSLSHRFIDDQRAEEGMNSYTREFDHQMDERVVKLWREGKFKEFCTMLPEYADYCYGEGNMHDTVMLLGLLGWDKYDGKVEFITELFASSGTGQVNAVFPLPAQA